MPVVGSTRLHNPELRLHLYLPRTHLRKKKCYAFARKYVVVSIHQLAPPASVALMIKHLQIWVKFCNA